MHYSNPRMQAVIANWPHGKQRVTAVFVIETHPVRGQRAVRTTTGAPKKLTFALQARIVDGDDGRTYIAELSTYGFIHVMRGDMRIAHETVHKDDVRHAELMALFTHRPPTCVAIR
jgi:hypothetical protein